MSANPWVRPYVLTGGRTRTKHHLYVHTLVSVERYDPAASLRLSPEARRLYERASFGPSRWRSCRRTAACRSASRACCLKTWPPPTTS